jgi:hypothetical protein
MGMIATNPPLPQGSINQRDYIRIRRKTEIACEIRRRSNKNDSKEYSITSIYNPNPQAYKLKNYKALLLKISWLPSL